MAKFNVGQYLGYSEDSTPNHQKYGFSQVLNVDLSNRTYTLKVIDPGTYGGPKAGYVWSDDIINLDAMMQLVNYSPTTTPSGGRGSDFHGLFTDWWVPMSPDKGPPFPHVWKVYWPWYKGERK